MCLACIERFRIVGVKPNAQRNIGSPGQHNFEGAARRTQQTQLVINCPSMDFGKRMLVSTTQSLGGCAPHRWPGHRGDACRLSPRRWPGCGCTSHCPKLPPAVPCVCYTRTFRGHTRGHNYANGHDWPSMFINGHQISAMPIHDTARQ